MFEGQPRGLWALAFANTGERFGYYTMLAVFILFLQANFGWNGATAGLVYSSFLMLVYFLPLFGGIAADLYPRPKGRKAESFAIAKGEPLRHPRRGISAPQRYRL